MRNPTINVSVLGFVISETVKSKGISLALLGFEKVKRKPNRLKSIVTQNRTDLSTGHITFSYNHGFSLVLVEL